MACNSSAILEAVASPTPTFTVTFTPTPTPLPPTHTPTSSPTPTPTITPTSTPLPTPIANITGAAEVPVMPEVILDEEVSSTQPYGEGLTAYRASTSVEAVQEFYRETLTSQGWEWIYTDTGEFLVLALPTQILVQEFERNQTKLTVIAIDGTFLRIPPPSVLVMAAKDIGSEQLMTFIGGGSLMGTYDLQHDSANAVDPSAVRFTSNLLQFDHPSNWFPTQAKSFHFRTDIEEGAISIFDDPTPCANQEIVCFINFTFLHNLPFRSPIMIGIHRYQEGITLETFDAQRWNILTEVSELPLAESYDIRRFEDLIAPNSLELLETKSLMLRDSTPAFQRIYRWRQIGLSTSLVSSYTLFKRNDAIIEFRTDFTEEEWTSFGPHVQETILSIELSP